MPARFGRRPFLHSWVHLFTEWQRSHNDVADTSSASLTSGKSTSFDTIIVEWPRLDAAWLSELLRSTVNVKGKTATAFTRAKQTDCALEETWRLLTVRIEAVWVSWDRRLDSASNWAVRRRDVPSRSRSVCFALLSTLDNAVCLCFTLANYYNEIVHVVQQNSKKNKKNKKIKTTNRA